MKNETNYVLKLLDGAIIDISEEKSSHSGCETCDYGSEYINEIEFKMTKHTFTLRSCKMYEHAFTDGWFIRILCGNIDEIKNMTEEQFKQWIFEKAKKEYDENKWVDYGGDYGVTLIVK